MISFDSSKLRVEIVQLKSITTALGGSINVVDSEKTIDGKEVLKRITVPTAVARAFIVKTKKVTKYLKPVFTAIVWYDNHIVSMERHPLAGLGALETEGLDGQMKRWVPNCERHVTNTIKPVGTDGTDWFFDGRYVYSFLENDPASAVSTGQTLTADQKFRKVTVSAYDLMKLQDEETLVTSPRTCMAFQASTGEFAISPPIWKDLSDVGLTQIARSQADDEEDDDTEPEEKPSGVVITNSFDEIDNSLAVNLNFALKAGREIGKQFGYEFVEPLHLPRLMIEMHTVNLPSVPKHIKATYDIGLKFTHAMAWLIGMSRKANDLDTYIMMRSLMKYLTKRGIFRSNVFNMERVYIGGVAQEVPLISLDDVMDEENHRQLKLSMFLASARSGGLYSADNIQNVGGMMTED